MSEKIDIPDPDNQAKLERLLALQKTAFHQKNEKMLDSVNDGLIDMIHSNAPQPLISDSKPVDVSPTAQLELALQAQQRAYQITNSPLERDEAISQANNQIEEAQLNLEQGGVQ